ncbi:polysaccharide deacetylase family protein [Terriglobus sp.]|uniref:polysaccharide deacetylase family protein n=1 Tax=Terriglobus sp. TaxID=1889013 RepID=UPI003AFFCCFC
MTPSSEIRAVTAEADDAQCAQVPLLYHELRPEPSAYSYVLPCSRFAEHLRMFARLRREAPGSYVPLVTFDDGHLSNHTHALPMLDDACVKAHFFITAGWTGTRDGYMEPRHLRELHAAGHTLGAHSWSHALLTGCSDVELRRELCDAKSSLQDWIGAPVTSLSLPGGRGDARVLRACREAGYTTVWTSVPGVTRSAVEPVVGRFNILAGMADAALERLLDPASGALQRARRISRAKAAAQHLLGDSMYARLWALVNRQEVEGAPQ